MSLVFRWRHLRELKSVQIKKTIIIKSGLFFFLSVPAKNKSVRGWDNLHDFQSSSVMKWQHISSFLHQQKCKTDFLCNLSHVPAHLELWFFFLTKKTSWNVISVSSSRIPHSDFEFSPESEILLVTLSSPWNEECK